MIIIKQSKKENEIGPIAVAYRRRFDSKCMENATHFLNQRQIR